MIKIVKFIDKSLAIGNNDDKFQDYINSVLPLRGGLAEQFLVCKDEVDLYIKSLMKNKETKLSRATNQLANSFKKHNK